MNAELSENLRQDCRAVGVLCRQIEARIATCTRLIDMAQAASPSAPGGSMFDEALEVRQRLRQMLFHLQKAEAVAAKTFFETDRPPAE